jgi:hypothetical protein
VTFTKPILIWKPKFSLQSAKEKGELTREHEDYATLTINPMLMEDDQLRPHLASICLEIVPWKPVRHVIALQLLPAIIDSHCAVETQTASEPVILLGNMP